MAATKICTNPQGMCPMPGIEQPVKNFNKNSDKRYPGPKSECKECQRARNGSIRRNQPKRTREQMLARNHLGEKQCGRCDEWLPETCYTRYLANIDNLFIWCNRCRADHLKSLTAERRRELLEQQGGMCAGPDCTFIFDIHGGPKKSYCIDHLHECCPGQKTCGKCTRALLCQSCNGKAGTVEQHLKWLAYCLEYEKGAPVEAEAPFS